MLDPFRLFGRLILASVRVTGYLLVAIVQAAWFFLHGRSDKVGEVFGWLGKGITDALTEAFKG